MYKTCVQMLSMLVIAYRPMCMRYSCVMQALRRQSEWDLNLATAQWIQLKKLLFLRNVVCKSCMRLFSRWFQFIVGGCFFLHGLPFSSSFYSGISCSCPNKRCVFSSLNSRTSFRVRMHSHINKLMRCKRKVAASFSFAFVHAVSV